jgi:hypothetical protein
LAAAAAAPMASGCPCQKASLLQDPHVLLLLHIAAAVLCY